jgi:hypothetical protein
MGYERRPSDPDEPVTEDTVDRSLEKLAPFAAAAPSPPPPPQPSPQPSPQPEPPKEPEPDPEPAPRLPRAAKKFESARRQSGRSKGKGKAKSLPEPESQEHAGSQATPAPAPAPAPMPPRKKIIRLVSAVMPVEQVLWPARDRRTQPIASSRVYTMSRAARPASVADTQGASKELKTILTKASNARREFHKRVDAASRAIDSERASKFEELGDAIASGKYSAMQTVQVEPRQLPPDPTVLNIFKVALAAVDGLVHTLWKDSSALAHWVAAGGAALLSPDIPNHETSHRRINCSHATHPADHCPAKLRCDCDECEALHGVRVHEEQWDTAHSALYNAVALLRDVTTEANMRYRSHTPAERALFAKQTVHMAFLTCVGASISAAAMAEPDAKQFCFIVDNGPDMLREGMATETYRACSRAIIGWCVAMFATRETVHCLQRASAGDTVATHRQNAVITDTHRRVTAIVNELTEPASYQRHIAEFCCNVTLNMEYKK